MKRLTACLTLALVLVNYDFCWALSSQEYRIIQESLYFATSVGCLAFALIIFHSLKGGSLGTPWLFIFAGFLFAAAGGAIHLLDLFKILIHVYDLRPALLITNCGSMIFFLIGLILYKRGLR
ncbi:MAG: hypothetical protein JSW64_13190 [Candidatus Zixiibacteriota bacterium]|nr:MAG: hypothetical protein JSW64_13190 [candidate division Zixibacteria bacterium]